MAASTKRREPAVELTDEIGLPELIENLYLEAADLVSRTKVTDTISQWLSKSHAPNQRSAMAYAFLLALDLEMFAPSLGGATTIDRLSRRRRFLGGEAEALAALKQARFAPLMIDTIEPGARFVAKDLFVSGTIDVMCPGVRPEAAGVAVAARLVPLPSGAFVTVGAVTPLDEAGLAVALEFLRPGKATNTQRCAAAVYRHVVRHGNPIVPGFNEMPDDPSDGIGEASYQRTILDEIVIAWLALKGADPSEEMIERVRATTSPMSVVEAWFKCFAGASVAHIRDIVAPYRWIAELQTGTLYRRAAAQSGEDSRPFETVAAIMDHEIAFNDYPPGAKALFTAYSKSLEASAPRQAAGETTRVVERIRALRAKTLDRGCSEAEALTAAAKVAELLDRYGLTLSEIDIRRQTCEGIGIESTRKRRGPIDECLDAIATFCDCRVWQETSMAGTLRTVFFGLPTDVEAARFLHGRIEAALDTETRAFQSGPLYADLRGVTRRAATTSFQVGVGSGICGKLRGLKAGRDEARSDSGRALVLVKSDVVDDEMDKLGLNFVRKTAKRHAVEPRAFREGQIAGSKFEARDSVR